MKTGAHVLNLKQIGASAASWGFRGECSCGNARWKSVPDRATLRELHDIHVQEAIEAEREVRNGGA